MKHICKIEGCSGYGYIRDDVVAELKDDDGILPIPTLVVEFLGHLSYAASAVNNSRNPKKAACTLMDNKDPKKRIKMFKMFQGFLNKKANPEQVKIPEGVDLLIEEYQRKTRKHRRNREPEANFDDIAAFHNMGGESEEE
jgi:hypothetical protein